MASAHERFWEHDSFVVAGDSTRRSFPLLTYRGLKRLGKAVVPVDLGGKVVDGDRAVGRIEDLLSITAPAVLALKPGCDAWHAARSALSAPVVYYQCVRLQ